MILSLMLSASPASRPNGLSKAISGLSGAKWGGETPNVNSDGGITGSRRSDAALVFCGGGAGGIKGVRATTGVINAEARPRGIANAEGFLGPSRGGSDVASPVGCDDELKLSRSCFMLILRRLDSRLGLRECRGE